MFQVINLGVKKGNEEIVRDISFRVEEGEFINIIGPSGGGKSTLLRTLNCLDSFGSGDIQYKNKSISDIDPIQIRKEVGYVFQAPYLLGEKVRENIEYPLQLHNIQMNEYFIQELLKALDLKSDILEKKCIELSGGEQQRISLMRTLMLKPRVLLLDEVTASLDPVSTRLVEELLMDLNEVDKTTIIMVTHNIEQARRMGKRTIFLANGKVIEDMLTEEFFKNQSNETILSFIKKAE